MVESVLPSLIVSDRRGLPFSRPGWKFFFVLGYAGVWLLAAWPRPVRAEILWSDPASRVIHLTPDGTDILGGKVKRDDKASDALYFKFRVDPLSDPADEPYYALFQLVESNQMRLGVGNAMEAWGYSAAYTSETGPSNKPPNELIQLRYDDAGEYNLRSSHPAAAGMGKYFPYELPSHNHPQTIVFKVQYVPGGDDLVTVWLDPNLTHGATAENQPDNITTKFKAKATFDQIRLRHGGNGGIRNDGGNGWFFSDMAIATSFNDFVVVRFWQTWWFNSGMALLVLAAVGASVRMVERRKYQLQLQRAEQQHALEQERARIAQDLHDELGSTLTRLSLLSGLIERTRTVPNRWRSTPANWPSPPTKQCGRWRKSSGRCVRAATRCKALRTTSPILRMNSSTATARAAGWICRMICLRRRCRRMSATTFFLSSRKR